MSEYQEFTGKSVEEAIKTACDQFGVGLGDLDFELLTPGSRAVLGMGAEPARIVAAPRSALGGSAPKREAAEATPLPARPREDRPFGDRDRDRGRGGNQGRHVRLGEQMFQLRPPEPHRPHPPAQPAEAPRKAQFRRFLGGRRVGTA